MCVLGGEDDRAPDVVLGELAQIDAAERDGARDRVDEAHEQVRDRRLAGTARSREHDAAARFEPQVDVVQHHVILLAVAEADGLQRERADGLRVDRARVLGVMNGGARRRRAPRVGAPNLRSRAATWPPPATA